MSAERDVTRVVRSWLREDDHDSADRVLHVVLDRLDTTPQRRSWWPARRFIQMNTYARFAVAAAAVLVVAVVGYNLLPRSGGIGGEPTTTPTATPATPTQAVVLPTGSIPPGTFLVDDPDVSVPFTLAMPAGWSFAGGFIQEGLIWAPTGEGPDGSGVGIFQWKISHVYADSCQWGGTLVPVADPAALVAAFAAHNDDVFVNSGAEQVSVGGLEATRFTFSLALGFDTATCTNGLVRLWPDPGPNESGGWAIFPGQETVVYVLASESTPTVLVTVRHANSAPAAVAELQAILDSVRFLP